MVNNPKLFRILTPLVILAAVLWWWSPIKVSVGSGGGKASSRQDSPESILQYVRASKSPLILLNFWASWCQPCKEELPAIKSLNEEFAGKGLKVILISIDDPDEVDIAINYLKDNALDFTTFYKGGQSLKFVSHIYPQWTGAVPATLLMNSDLKILDAWEGDSSLEELKQRVQKQLRGT